MTSLPAVAAEAAVAVLLLGLGAAGVQDWRRREVDWEVWGAMGAAGVVLGAVEVSPGGGRPVLLWLVVGALLLEHFVPWDERLGESVERHADAIEIAAYLAVTIGVIGAAVRYGIGPDGVPVGAVVLLATIVLARVLFVANILYGAADAQALMVTSALVPVFAHPWLYAPGATSLALGYVPFAVSMLTNAALFSLAVPIYLALRNLGRGEFTGAGGFLGFSIPVRELPDRFVWVRDPAVAAGRQDDLETAAEDAVARREIAEELTAKGVRRVWVGPQIPLVTVMALGAVSALLAGNLLLDVMVH